MISVAKIAGKATITDAKNVLWNGSNSLLVKKMRDKLIKLLKECDLDENTYGECADHLIANGVTIQAKKRQPTDLRNKCGSCKYAYPTSDFAGSSHMICTNKDKWWNNSAAMYKPRTKPACKKYEAKENGDE